MLSLLTVAVLLLLLVGLSFPVAELPPAEFVWVMRSHVTEVTEDVLKRLVVT